MGPNWVICHKVVLSSWRQLTSFSMWEGVRFWGIFFLWGNALVLCGRLKFMWVHFKSPFLSTLAFSIIFCTVICHHWLLGAEMCSERDSPLKRLYRRTHAKLTRLAGSGQLVWAAGCKLSLALVHARRPAWPGETSETILRVAPPR